MHCVRCYLHYALTCVHTYVCTYAHSTCSTCTTRSTCSRQITCSTRNRTHSIHSTGNPHTTRCCVSCMYCVYYIARAVCVPRVLYAVCSVCSVCAVGTVCCGLYPGCVLPAHICNGHTHLCSPHARVAGMFALPIDCVYCVPCLPQRERSPTHAALENKRPKEISGERLMCGALPAPVWEPRVRSSNCEQRNKCSTLA